VTAAGPAIGKSATTEFARRAALWPAGLSAIQCYDQTRLPQKGRRLWQIDDNGKRIARHHDSGEFEAIPRQTPISAKIYPQTLLGYNALMRY
jgi:hypothetical protein